MSFEKLNLIDALQKALKTEGYTIPTPIQKKAIPIILQRKDLLGCAQTGTGKTAAFALPIIQLLTENQVFVKGKKKIRSLILTPTRELAIQIGESFNAYGKFAKLNSTVIFGGVTQSRQTDALAKGVDILVATPGRLLDLINQQFIQLKDIEIFVLDEADRMLDMGFVHDVKRIIAMLPNRRQSLFFSATMPPTIIKLAGTILTNPVEVTVKPIIETADLIQQTLYFVDKSDKHKLLLHVLENKELNSALIFTRTKHGADKLSRILVKSGIKTEAIHGNKSQNARQSALNNFKSNTTRVLVATDIAARGIDVDDLACVINYEIPNIPETYIHRIGRTGRAGAKGIAISFCDAEEKAYLKDIYKLISKEIPLAEENPFPLNNQEQAKVALKKPEQHKNRSNTRFKDKPFERKPKKTFSNKRVYGN